MQSISYFLVCCILTVGDGDTNIDYLLDQYILICGNMLCDQTITFAPKIPEYLSTCTECSCDDNCIFNGSCCPDKFFSLKMECTNTSIVSQNTESRDIFEDLFLMRVTCPEGTNPSSQSKCESNRTFSEKIQYMPVTSSTTMITYKNEFCAECNNESYYEQWIFNSVCDEFVDFNFISTLDEMFKTAVDRKCKISSNITGLNTAGCYRTYGYNTIKTCNVTGSWITYNKDIEWACLHYNNRFLEFKNVFCYICNPPVNVEEVLTDCNATWKLYWYEEYPNFQKACKELDLTTATYPFKNIYCQLCNSLPFRVNDRRVFLYFDASVNIEEKVVNGNYFKYMFELNFLNGEFIDSYLKKQAYRSSETQLTTNHPVNLTEIYTHYYAMTGNGHFCLNISTNVIADERHNCGCSAGCHFDFEKPCCIDADFKYSTSCIDGYLVYDGCEEITKDFNMLSSMCQNREGNSDLFSSIPVFDKQQGANYKNIYCAMCSNHKKVSEAYRKAPISAIKRFKPWKFTLICKKIIPIYFHTFLSHLFDTRFLSNCNFTLVPDICHKRCPTRPAYTIKNTSISWACENFKSTPTSVDFYYKIIDSSLNEYHNIFCAMEETFNETTTLIQQCNVTGRWNFNDEHLQRKCRQLPQIDFHHPYKNIFCKMCNEELIEYVNNYVGIATCYESAVGNADISFRSLFSFLSYEEQQDTLVHGICKQSQLYDSIKDRCRDIVCYPGRVLMNGTCIPLLPYTANLGYTLTFGVHVQSEAPIKDLRFLLQLMKLEILNQLGKHLNRTMFPFLEMLIMKANNTCSSNENIIGSYLHISVFLKLFVNVVVNRDEFETKLLQFHNQEFSFEHLLCSRFNKTVNCILKYRVKYDNGSLYLPIDLPFRRFDTTKCYLKTNNEIPESQKYIHSHISSLLKCPQIELDKAEVIIDESKNLLRVPQYSTVLDYYNFYFTRSDRNIRICLNTFKRMMVSTSEMSVLQIIMLIFTTLSLLCLFLTFMTYCMFAQLRTLPGKNNMCLVVVLFFAMAFLEFGMNKTTNITLCIVLGGFIHYFWLCTFCCLNVCSFHMYCTFSRDSVYRQRSKSNERKRLLQYMLYSFGLPAIIVISNILFTNSLKSKELYGYGGKLCFISERLSFIVAFIVPITTMCLLNIFFFIFSARSIATTPKLKNDDSFRHNSVNLAVYIKLFTITGSSWVLQIIDSFLPLSPFSVIVSLLNAMQGIYIFVAYICNKRIFILYRSLICNKHVIRSDSESRTVTQTTSLTSTKLLK